MPQIMDEAHPSPAEPTPETSAEPSFSTFNRAFQKYLADLPEDTKRSKFFELCHASGNNVTPQTINELFQGKATQRAPSGPIQRIFSRIMNALMDYSEVIGPLVSFHPVPCAIIWGAFKVVIESLNRCESMFESMQKELRSLVGHLQCITVYEDLYGDSEEMQDLLFNSYTHIIRFWYRVHKECKRKGLATFGRAMTTSALKKMNSIISEIQSVSESISKQALLCQGQKDKQEYAEAHTARELQSEWHQKQSDFNYFGLYKQIRDHLTPPYNTVARPNSRRHDENVRYLQPETCQWLIQESCYTTWCGPRSEARRLFCLSGPLGCGKSMLTSFAIRDLESKGAAVAYYFCQFSQPCEYPIEILRLLALQLFDVYFSRHLPLDQEFAHCMLRSRKPEDVQDRINDLVSKLLSEGGVYFFIDGLDEAIPAGISSVLEFLNNLLKEQATEKVGLWVTKRRQAQVVEYFEKHIQPDLGLTLELVNHTNADVVRFLTAKLHDLKQRFCPQQDDLDETDRKHFQRAENYLMSHAQGNFLWARLMTQRFDEVNRVEDVLHILSDAPKELVDLYKSYFDRFGRWDREDKRIAINVMSLVAFARRQLRLEELQEAAAVLASHRKKKKAASDAAHSIRTLPLKTFLAMYTTLVELDGNTSDPNPTDTCRLVHFSVLEFLKNNPATLAKDSKDHQLHFSPFALANACLIYLTRPAYTKVLQKQSEPDGTYTWVDSTGETVYKQVFSQYAAKYWVRHLDDLEEEEQDKIRGRVEAFVSSNSFQTCMQIQSIWVQGWFDVYAVQGQRSLPRALPRGMPELLTRTRRLSDSKRLITTRYRSDYQELIHDWRKLLSCGGCRDSDSYCSYLTLRGESDRIWWTTFGPDHLFSDFQSRYRSFRLSERTCSERFEALSVSKEQIVAVRLKNWKREDGSLQFVCEHWTLSDHVSAPSLGKKQIITTTEAATNWLLYAKPPPEGLKRLVASPTALSGNAQILRLGAQLFRKDEDNEYRVVASGGDAPAYFEEVSGRGALVVIGSRSHTLAAQLQEPYRLFERLGKDFTHLERLENPSDTKDDPCTISDESDDEWLSEVSSDSSDVEMEAYESWSDASTDEEGYLSSNSSSESEVSEQSTSDTGSEAETEEGSISGSSGGRSISDTEEESWGRKIDARLGAMFHGRPLGQTYDDMRSSSAREPTVLLTALQYDDNSTPTKLFEYSCPLWFMLYDSPPAVHPQESLVVWPLGSGDLLFADVTAKTYFTRQLRPSASHARQISVKTQFSPCGLFLHVASVEVRLTVVEGDQLRKNKRCFIHHPLHLYMLVFIYRLSTRKPTRSPPVLIHCARADLGKHEGLSLSQLPFIFTWTPRHLFLSGRETSLEVFRIQLFSKCTGDGCLSEQNVLVPMNKMLLPDSAARRDVYFVPLSDDPNGASMVVIGSESRVKAALVLDETSERRTFAPSIGAILRAEDIGGWIRAGGTSVPQGRSMGNLDIRKEKFHPVEDCDG
ncbi:hypothetical protein F5887DRAFT_1257428 [Amanita rubescens]|nr:hypothetical protein F5887DRAFT_1257428 [Amanita rubescens]